MNTNNLTFVDIFGVAEEHAATLLQVKQGVTEGLAFHHRHQHTVLTGLHFTLLHFTVVIKNTGHNARTRGHGQEAATETNQPTGWNQEFELNSAFTVRLHIGQLAFTQAQLFHDRTLVLIFNIDHHLLVGLLGHAIHFTLNHFGTGHTHLKTFATHGFNQYREV